MTTISVLDGAAEPVRYMRSVRIEATYGAVPWACPESVSVEWCEPDTMPDGTEINSVIAQLAAVPAAARVGIDPVDGARERGMVTVSGGAR